MKPGAIEILLIVLGSVVLALIALWIREAIVDWCAPRHHRAENRRGKVRGRRGND
jgi:hypothetical protein